MIKQRSEGSQTVVHRSSGGRMSETVMTPRPTSPVVCELRVLVRSGNYPQMLRRSTHLADLARWSTDAPALIQQLTVVADEGPIAAMIAIECLAEIRHGDADDVLVDLLRHQDLIVRRHAAWRLGDRKPTARAIPELVAMITLGGIDTMHANRTLANWSESTAHLVVRSAVEFLVNETNPAMRARLVDLLGVAGRCAEGVLLTVAADLEEAVTVRAAAIGALGEMGGNHIDAMLRELAAIDGPVAVDSAMALGRRAFGELPNPETVGGDGLRVAQLVLAEGLDGQLSLGGRGDTGGVASLLVSLGEALANRPDVDHVLTIGRGSSTDAFAGPHSSSRIPLTYGTIAFGDDVRPAETPDEIWEHIPAIRRGIRRSLRIAGPVDLLHLRMADAGTVAGAEVAKSLGVPICFSVAPDPHNVVESMHSRGELDDEAFVRLVTESHVWFRARLVERLAGEADQLALFPRTKQIDFLEDLASDTGQRMAVVAEGIDISLLDRAVRDYSIDPQGARRNDVLDELTGLIPAERRGLPLVLSVGRLNPVKGMDRVVSAWASDHRLAASCNLVIVGGSLDEPSATETSVLEAIDRALPLDDPNRAGLILLGGRPRADVARILVATSVGRTNAWSGGGVYVDGALKEEFGLAVLEAMAAGLVVVAPSTGGPSTYVDHGDTGVLVAPEDDLGFAIRGAFGLVDRIGRAERARSLVESQYSIATMADQLLDLYRPAMAMR